MKRILCVFIIALLMLPVGPHALANWWDGIGAQDTPTPTPEPESELEQESESTDESGLTWESLFDGWSPTPDETEEPGFDGEPDLDMTLGNYDDSEQGDVVPEYEGDDGEYDYDYDPDYDYADNDGEYPIEEGDDLAADEAANWPNALFDPGVQEYSSRPYGNAVECVIQGDWTIARGYYLDDYRITCVNQNTYGRQVMTDAVMVFQFVPAGNGIIYYGEATKGRSSWLYKLPGDASPYELPLTDKNSVFYADEQYIWYYTYGKGSERPISRMGYDGKNKKQLGKVNATVIAMMDDGSVLAAAYSKNQVILWKDGKSKVVYDPKKEITNVISTGRTIWVQHENDFGLLEDGEITFSMPGYIRSMGRTSDQMVFVVDPGNNAARYDVLMFNEPYRAWARVGDIMAQVNINVELEPTIWMTIWGPSESMVYMVPAPDQWLPYGHLTAASAAAAGFTSWLGDSAPGLSGTLDAEMLVRRVPSSLFVADGNAVALDANRRGIYAMLDRDDLYSFHMTPSQYEQLLRDLRGTLAAQLEDLVHSGTISSYAASNDYSQIEVSVDAAAYERESALLDLLLVGLGSAAYQSFQYETEDPSSTIRIVDAKTGQALETLRAPGDFLLG